MAHKQLELESIVEEGFRSHEKRMLKYMKANVAEYRVAARLITPSFEDDEAIFARVAFAILSANAPFDDSVKALNYALTCPGTAEAKHIARFKMVPAKARYINDAWLKIRGVQGYKLGESWYKYQVARIAGESWQAYRYRLKDMFKGLGITKASFAASLLYPLLADVACLDTWMQKVFLRRASFTSLGAADYERIEQRIRRYARDLDCSTFIAQWMIWDHARGGKFNAHAIFPGSHKGSEAL